MQNRQQGQSVVEVLIALAVMTMCVAAVGTMVLDAERSTIDGLMRMQASFIAEEGIEAVRSIRDGDFVGLTAGIHGVALVGGRFEFANASDVEGEFSRTVEIEDVDAHTKLVTSTVTWNTMREGDKVEVGAVFTDR